eukprot:TRINITY_DN642_c0_g1_i1.p1 TRINITY_DN642_c0_g1~~TRINITY_DN642_c0_g1_i1.p1  ORF type:complete len:161 (+),score=16.74 TRINITY_DN642_c0_g1_i1:388-870(+)
MNTISSMFRSTIHILSFFLLYIFLPFGRADCDQFHDCSSCTGSSKCAWCKTNGVCVDGSFFGTADTCGGWRWKQCAVSGYVPIIFVLGVIVLILLIAFICACRFLLFQKRKKQNLYSDYIKYEDDEEMLYQMEKAREKRKEMAAKWGVRLSDSPDSHTQD